MYEISFEDAAAIQHLKLSGHWNWATFTQFTAALLLRTTLLRLGGRRYGVLSDSREFAVQSPAIAEAFKRVMAHGNARHVAAVAIVVGSKLNLLQVQRTLASDRVRAFDDWQQGHDWLVAQLAEPATA